MSNITFSKIVKTIPPIAVGSVLSACSLTSQPSDENLIGRSAVRPVITEHSMALKCMGQVIEASDAEPVIVYVDDIDDETVPRFFRDRGLSKGAQWLFHTAISKMETSRVASTMSRPDKKGSDDHILTIKGAWTQDDRSLVEKQGGFNAILGIFGARANAQQDFSMVTGDFASIQSGLVSFSSAVGLVIENGRAEARLFVEDGGDEAQVQVRYDWADGFQMAQRRIVEAATLVHVAHHLGMDFRPCMEAGWGNGDIFRELVTSFEEGDRSSRYQEVQISLNAMGYDAGEADGIWDEKSKIALTSYLFDRGLPPSSKLTGVVYALVELGRQSNTPARRELARAENFKRIANPKLKNGKKGAKDAFPTDEEVMGQANGFNEF